MERVNGQGAASPHCIGFLLSDLDQHMFDNLVFSALVGAKTTQEPFPTKAARHDNVHTNSSLRD